jgi:DNA polymerase-1
MIEENNGLENKYNVLIFDTSNIYIRWHFALLHRQSYTNPETFENIETGGISTLVKSFLKYLQTYSPSLEKRAKIIWAEEGKGSKEVRRKLYPEYKNNRPPLDPSLRVSYNIMLDIIKNLSNNMFICQIEGREADDCFPYIINNSRGNKKFLIISNDSDLSYLLKQDKVAQLKGSDDLWTEKRFKEEKGFDNATGVQLEKCIRGDSGDNIPKGVKGIRETVLTPILKKYKNVDDFLEKFQEDDAIPPQWKTKIDENRDQLKLNEQLVHSFEITDDMFDKGLVECKFNPDTLYPLLDRYELFEVKGILQQNEDWLK